MEMAGIRPRGNKGEQERMFLEQLAMAEKTVNLAYY